MGTSDNRNWLMYAAGGGYGHLNRSLAFARTAVKIDSNRNVTIIANRDAVHRLSLKKIAQQIRIVPLDTSISNDEFQSNVHDLLRSSCFDALIVDSFPRGVIGELDELLPRITCPKIFVHRDMVTEYINREEVVSAVNQFDHILVPGESAPLEHRTNATRTAPWLIRDADELYSIAEARRCLKVDDSTLPICLVSLSGKMAERMFFAELAFRLEQQLHGQAVIRLAGELPRGLPFDVSRMHIRFWPLIQVLPAVDFLIGAGGYNTVFEAMVTKTTLLAIPQSRMYDRQAKRLSSSQTFSTSLRLIHSLGSRLKKMPPRVQKQMPHYENGTFRAVKEVESIIETQAAFGSIDQ